MSEDNPGVKFPPPAIFLISILIGLGIHRYFPIAVVASALSTPLGAMLSIVAAGIALLGFRELGRHETTVRPDAAASSIVKTGPYRFTRNPLYVALSTLQLGIGLWTNNLWIVLMLIPAWILMTTQVIAREEAYLERAFGDEYLSYKRSVRRWI